MSKAILVNCRAILPDKIVDNAAVGISHGKIIFIKEAGANGEYEFNDSEYKDYQIIDLFGSLLAPGYIDLHVHGGLGADFYDGGRDNIKIITNYFARHGTTTLFATITTADMGRMERAMEDIINFIEDKSFSTGASIGGIYVEGPFCNVKRKGTFKAEYLLMPDTALMKSWIKAYGKHLKFIGLAPELEGSGEVIELLLENGIMPCIAHSDATCDEALKAIELGATHVTHCYNAMSGLHHREPGIVGTVLVDPRVTTEIICDFHHVHPMAIKLLLSCKMPEKVCLITDAMRATGLPDGEYVISEQKAVLKDGQVKIGGTTLAGSVLTMERAVKNVYQLGYGLTDVIKMATLTPAKIAGIDREVGSIEVGKDADLIVLNDNLDVCATLLKGETWLIDSSKGDQMFEILKEQVG